MHFIYQKVILKRWYVFLLMGMMGFVMLFLTFYETSHLFRNSQRLIGLYQKKDQKAYELRLEPHVVDEVVLPYSHEQIEQFYHLIETAFFKNKSGPILYQNKWNYIGGERLKNIDFASFKQKLLLSDDGIVDELFLDDLLILDTNDEELHSLSRDLEKHEVQLSFVSLGERFTQERNYYVQNAVTAVGICIVIFLFIFLLMHRVIVSSLDIYKQEIRLLRILGSSKRSLTIGFSHLLFGPNLISTFLVLLFSYIIGFGVTVYDYLYLFFVNSLVWVSIYILVASQLRRKLYA